MNIKLNEKTRKELWDEMVKVEFKIKELKGIFQNEIPITEQVIIQFVDGIQDVMNELAEVQDNFEIKLKAEALYQQFDKIK
ncbi:MAG: hypothetical protein E7H33_09055 [Clostridium perfringens]|nr:hypothetical protein [Clostridium perfringens]